MVNRLHEELVKISAMADYREPLERQGLEPQSSTPAEFAAFLRSEHGKWGRVISALRARDAASR